MLNFGNSDTEFPLPSSATHAWSAQSEKEKNIYIFDKLIVAMPLPKQEKKNCNNCGNSIAENGGKNVIPKSRKSKKKKCYVHNIFTINHM